MKLTLKTMNIIPWKWGSELVITKIWLYDDYGKYIKWLSVEEALPYLQDHTFSIPNIEKYEQKPSYFDNVIQWTPTTLS